MNPRPSLPCFPTEIRGPSPLNTPPHDPFYPILTLRPTSPHPSAASIPLRRAPPRRASARAQSRRSTTFQPTRATVEESLCAQESNPGVPTLGAPSQRLLPELRSTSASAPRLDLATGTSASRTYPTQVLLRYLLVPSSF